MLSCQRSLGMESLDSPRLRELQKLKESGQRDAETEEASYPSN